MSDLEVKVQGIENLTVLRCVQMLAEASCRTMMVQFDGAPMLVRVTLEFPDEEAKLL